jgi:hypothetical protein
MASYVTAAQRAGKKVSLFTEIVCARGFKTLGERADL